MVNYARAGRSQRKLWWRTAAVLTCKSIVRPGYRGERLIEPSSSWFPPKFPYESAAKEQAKDIPVVHLKTVLSEKKAAAAADTTVVTVTVDSGIGTMINNTPFSLSRNLSQSQLSDVES